MDAAQLSAHIDARALSISQIDAPAWYIKRELKALFSDAAIYDQVVSSSPLTVAPIISELLFSSSPPSSLDFMTALPQVGQKKVWAVYGHRMQKPGFPDKAYVGIGTDSVIGVSRRLRHYYPGSGGLPRLVKQTFDDGYTITATGLLCWTDLPSLSLGPRLGARFKLLETIFTISLRAISPYICDFYIEDFFLWKDQSVPWGGLCSQLPLVEFLRDGLDLLPHQVEEIEAGKAKAARESKKAWKVRELEKDEEGFK
jgi:hypothetical protein